MKEIFEGIVVFSWLLFMSFMFGQTILEDIFHYDSYNNNPIKNTILYIIVGINIFVIGVPLVLYIKSLL